MTEISNNLQTTETTPNPVDGLCGVLEHGAGIRIVNLSGYALTVGTGDYQIVIPPADRVADFRTITEGPTDYRGITEVEVGVVGIPSQRDSHSFYVVSPEIAAYLTAHPDYSDEGCWVYPTGLDATGRYRSLARPRSTTY